MSRVAISYILFIYCFRESLLNKSYSVYPLMLTQNPDHICFGLEKKIFSYATLSKDLILDIFYRSVGYIDPERVRGVGLNPL